MTDRWIQSMIDDLVARPDVDDPQRIMAWAIADATGEGSFAGDRAAEACLAALDAKGFVVARKATPPAAPEQRLETDEEYRARLLMLVGAGSVNAGRINEARGAELDTIGEMYVDAERRMRS